MNDRHLFRVWCENKKEWEKDEVLISSNGNFVLMQNGIPIIKNTIPKHHIVEFCTGLKDKNGKLVFEGDICKFSDYIIGDFRQPESIEIIKFEENGYNEKLLVNYYDKPNWVEVIGNIHENPELLGGK